MFSERLRRPMGLARSVIAVGIAMAITVPLGSPASADSGTVPTLVDTLGGPLHAEIYPSGLETAPDGAVVIADTGNNQVAKYTAAGVQIWRVGSWGSGVGEFDNPRDVAVDSAGNVFVVDTRNSRVVKLSPTGTWLGTFGGTTGDTVNFPMGATVDNDVLYLADTGRKKVRKIDPATLTETGAVVADPDGGPGPWSGCRDLAGIRDATADDAGNVFVAGYQTNDVVKFDPTGNCTSWGTTGTGPGQFRTPYGVHTGLDPVLGQEVVWVADGLNSRVQEFSLTGTFLAQFGTNGSPTDVGTVTTMRRSALAPDGSGDIWIADLWGFRAERWARTPAGYEYAQTIGAPLPPATDSAVFQEPRGVAVGPDNVVNVVDTVHHRFVRMDSSGHILGVCGQRAAGGATLGEFNWPRGVAVDNATGEIWIADTKQHRLQVATPDCTGQAFIGESFSGPSPTAFNWPFDVAIRQSDRIAFVADNQNHRVKAYDVATRTVLSTIGGKGSSWTQFKAPGGLAVSPVNGNVFVADTENSRIKELATTNGVAWTVVRNFSVGFNQPEDVAVDSQGRIYVADSANDRIVILDANRVQIGTIDGLANPAAVNIGPGDRIYVSDTYNDAVKAYVWPAPDTVAPDGTITFPAANQQVALGALTVTGAATDNVGVSAVDVAIKSVAQNKWWNGTAWTTGFKWIPASVATPGATSTAWTYGWTPSSTGSYQVTVRAKDAAGNVDPVRPWYSFSVVGAIDTTAPDATVSVPTANQTFPGGPVAFSGQATDNVGVAAVKLAVKNRTTNQWWNGTTWVAGFVWYTNATLGSPGAVATTWTSTWTPPGTGNYAVMVRADDTAGNQDPTKPFVNFQVS